MRKICCSLILIFELTQLNIANSLNTVKIYYAVNAESIEIFAAREIQKYVYQRTGKLFQVVEWNGTSNIEGEAFIVGQLAEKISFSKYQLPKLEADAFVLKTINSNKGKKLIVYGGSSIGTLYAAYRYAEILGVGFYLDGDVVPDTQISFKFPTLNVEQKPLFALRGILPFHDFPEGPDLWNIDDYKAVMGQLPKLGMNFIGLHTYTQDPLEFVNSAAYEPMVWIGTKSNIKANGTVKMSYPSSHFTTGRGHGWSSYQTTYTSDFYYGASQLFELDDFGPDYMIENGRLPQSFYQQNELFNSFGSLLSDAFTFANHLGVKTCLGTETPLTIPKEVREHLKSMGKDPTDSTVVMEVYEGIFKRITATHPLDYYWIWTPEQFLSDNSEEKVEATIKDLHIAINAAQNIDAPFSLATCGWTLGPPSDRIMFDKVLPKNIPLSCINVSVGRDPVQHEFAEIQGRPKWAIPWLEDDPGMTVPQLWAGRMRKDAADALAYGCTGLMGIHWRTRILSPNVSALAKAAWDQTNWNPDFPDNISATDKSKNSERDLSVTDFYEEWAEINFGEEVADNIAKVFEQIDGEKLPKPATWEWGPGGIVSDERPWSEVQKDYLFVEKMENLRTSVKGAGNLDRFDYWLNQFRYIRSMGHFNCIWALYKIELDKVQKLNDKDEQRDFAINKVLPIRIKMIEIMGEIQNYLTASISTYGELGVLCNWQQRMFPKVIREPNLILEKYVGSDLPENATLQKEYKGAPDMVVPTNRGSLEEGEALKMKIRTISPEDSKPVSQKVYWKKPGAKLFQSKDLSHIDRGVYQLKLSPKDFDSNGLEYYVEIQFGNGDLKRFPASAPNINQIINVIPNK